MVELIELQDADFEWLTDERLPTRAGLIRPPGGLDDIAVLMVIRRMTRRLAEAGCRAAWMVVADKEVVGLCSYKAPPSAGQAEIGYGIAASRRTLGYATKAVGTIIKIARRDPGLRALVAETAVGNPASARVLEKNGFVEVGRRNDPEDGLMRLWELLV